tara:strand:+ start:194 stop:394 length:201 start_codon:yes stop_codon:yes gene_type:complete
MLRWTIWEEGSVMKYSSLLLLLIISSCTKAEIQSALCMDLIRIPEMEKRTGDVNVFDCLKIIEGRY